jgi:hypothetical protein
MILYFCNYFSIITSDFLFQVLGEKSCRVCEIWVPFNRGTKVRRKQRFTTGSSNIVGDGSAWESSTP